MLSLLVSLLADSLRTATRGPSLVMRRLLTAAALVAAAPGHAQAGVAVPANAIAVEPVVPCFVAPPKGFAVGAKFDCGYIVVPENAMAPAMLDAVILDGTNSLSRRSWIEDRALDIEFSMKHLDALCREDAKCRQAYDLPALVERAVALFDAGPISATFTDPKQPGVALPIELRRTDLLSTIYAMQGDKIGVMSLPALLDGLVRGGRASVAATLGPMMGQQLLAQRGARAGGKAILMHLAVVCSDDPVRSVDELVRECAAATRCWPGRCSRNRWSGYAPPSGCRSCPHPPTST
jgi:hypothetical protein